jgi:FkbM family methyltransferase
MPGMTAFGLAIVAVAIVSVILIRTVARRASALERQISVLREQTAAESAELRDALAGVLKLQQGTAQDWQVAAAAVASQIARLGEQMGLRLADVSQDVRNQSIDLRELVGAHSAAGRKDLEGRFSDLSKTIDTRPALAQVLEAVSGLSSQLTELLAPAGRLSGEVSAGPARLAALSEQVGGASDALQSKVSALIQPLSGSIAELSGKTGVLADMVESVVRKPPRDLPIDVTILERYTEGEIVTLAEALATLRPLVPYPRWHFDCDWANPDLAFQLRQWLWQYFNTRQAEGAVVVGWHHGTRLRLYLGNDLSRQIYIAGSVDPNEFAFLDRFLQPGMTFLDIGANEGIYSVFAARRVGAEGTVWAFEPSRRELDRLRCNLELNGLKVRVFPLALADSAGRADLRVAGYEHEGQNTLGAFAYAGVEAARTEPVDLMRLDDVVEQNPLRRLDAIKVDVEGAELRLFQGATATLMRFRPVLLFEASDAALRLQGASCEALFDHLRTQQYDLYAFDRHSGLPAPATPGAHTENMIAVPAGQSLPAAVYRSWPVA